VVATPKGIPPEAILNVTVKYSAPVATAFFRRGIVIA
jgi:hypothetical protein